jgi:hypothetical protein
MFLETWGNLGTARAFPGPRGTPALKTTPAGRFFKGLPAVRECPAGRWQTAYGCTRRKAADAVTNDFSFNAKHFRQAASCPRCILVPVMTTTAQRPDLPVMHAAAPGVLSLCRACPGTAASHTRPDTERSHSHGELVPFQLLMPSGAVPSLAKYPSRGRGSPHAERCTNRGSHGHMALPGRRFPERSHFRCNNMNLNTLCS